MSLVKIEGNASGTGVFTVASPNSNTDRTLTLPDTSGTLVAPSSAGTSGQVLTSNGAGSSPTYQDLPAGGVTSLNGQTGAITNTDLYAIGSYVTGRSKDNTNYAVNSTIAGSSLFATPPGARWDSSNSRFTPGVGSPLNITSSCPQVNTGTWRCVSPAYGDSSPNYSTMNGLWVRIS